MYVVAVFCERAVSFQHYFYEYFFDELRQRPRQIDLSLRCGLLPVQRKRSKPKQTPGSRQVPASTVSAAVCEALERIKSELKLCVIDRLNSQSAERSQGECQCVTAG